MCKYNSLFQMTSFGAKEIREGNFMPTFKVEGHVYHLIGSLLPPQGQNPQHLQIYFISDADQLSLRSNIAPTLNIDLINELQTALNSHNVFFYYIIMPVRSRDGLLVIYKFRKKYSIYIHF